MKNPRRFSADQILPGAGEWDYRHVAWFVADFHRFGILHNTLVRVMTDEYDRTIPEAEAVIAQALDAGLIKMVTDPAGNGMNYFPPGAPE